MTTTTSAAPRYAETLHGNLHVIGHTLVQSCAPDRVAPIQGSNAVDKIIDCTTETVANAIGDGKPNILDDDSDGDGLFDGAERSQPCKLQLV